MKFGAIKWDPYTKSEITKTRKHPTKGGGRFITKDHKSREDGCMTKMFEELNLPALATRRQQQRLKSFYKVVEGQIPAISSEDFIKFNKPKRLIRAKTYSDCERTNIVQSFVRNNSRSVVIPNCKTDQYRYSFFVRTSIDWNHLEEDTVRATKLENFKASIDKNRD